MPSAAEMKRAKASSTATEMKRTKASSTVAEMKRVKVSSVVAEVTTESLHGRAKARQRTVLADLRPLTGRYRRACASEFEWASSRHKIRPIWSRHKEKTEDASGGLYVYGDIPGIYSYC